MSHDDGKSPEAHFAWKRRWRKSEPTSLSVQVQLWEAGEWIPDFDQLRLWPTPRASMNENRNLDMAPSHGVTRGTTLAGTATSWPTPTARDTRMMDTPTRQGSPSLPHFVRFHPDLTMEPDGPSGSPKADLNPRFVEALMGLPAGWLTPCTSGATGSFREWRQKHSPPWRLSLASE